MLADGGLARAHHADQHHGLVQFHAECALVIRAIRSFHGLRLPYRDIASTQKENPQCALRAQRGQPEGATGFMKYLFRLILILVVLAAIAVVAYAYIGDMSPQRVPVSQPDRAGGQ